MAPRAQETRGVSVRKGQRKLLPGTYVVGVRQCVVVPRLLHAVAVQTSPSAEQVVVVYHVAGSRRVDQREH